MRLSVKYSSLSMKYRVLHSYKLFNLRKIFKLFEWNERFIHRLLRNLQKVDVTL